MKKGITGVIILLLGLIVVAGIITVISKGTLDNSMANLFAEDKASEVVEVNHNTNFDESSSNQETMIESLRVTLQKVNKENDNLIFTYNYQLIGADSARLEYQVGEGINNDDVEVIIDRNHQSIRIEVIHPFTEGIIDFYTSNEASASIRINLSEYSVSSLEIIEDIERIIF